MPEYALTLRFGAPDDKHAHRKAEDIADLAAAEHGTRDPIVTPADGAGLLERLATAERELNADRTLLRDVLHHLRVAHSRQVGRHDNWGPGYTCAGCALVERIDTHLHGAESPQDSQTPANPYPSEGQETTGAQEASQ